MRTVRSLYGSTSTRSLLAIAAEPDVFFETAHYDGHPILLVRLERADPAMLEDRIEESWLLRAPKRLVDAYLAERR